MKIEIVNSKGSKGIEVYGLRVITADGEYACDDLCTDRERLENFCDLLRDEKPELKQIPELVEDFIFVGL